MPSQDFELAAAFAALPAATAVLACDEPRFTILAASDAMAAALQRPRESIVGRSLAEVFSNASDHDPEATLGDLRASIVAAASAGITQHMPRQRYDRKRADGDREVRYWDAVNIPVRGPDGSVLCVLHQTTEVTTQVLAEAAAAQAEQRARRILEDMGDAHCVLDREFRIVSVNAATERLLGRPRESLLGRSHWDAFPASASADSPVGRALRRVVAGGAEEHLTHHYTGEGYDMHLELDAYPTEDGGVAIFWRDVTERLHAEAALRKAAADASYRAALTDALRGAADGFEIQEVATRMLGEHLRASRVAYGEADPASAQTFINHREYRCDDEIPTTIGLRRWEELGTSVAAQLGAGRTLVVDDTRSAAGPLADQLTTLELAGIRACVRAPLVRNGRILAQLAVEHEAPRTWTPEEIALVQETAELTWAAVERARAQAALCANEEKYRALFSEMDEAYAVVEVMSDDAGRWTDFRFLEVNPAFMRHTGMPYPVGRTATELLGTPNPRWAELYGRAAETGESIRLEETELMLGRVFDLNIFRLGHEESRRVAVLFTDITERKGAQEALKKGEERLRLAVEATGLGISDWDLVTDQVAVNERFREIFGVSSCGILHGSTLMAETVHPDDRTWVGEKIASAMQPRASGSFEVEHRTITPSGERWVLTKGQVHFSNQSSGPGPVRVVGNHLDVTARRRADDELRMSEQRYRSLFQNMIEAFAIGEMIWDESGNPVDWRYLEVNPAWAQTGTRVSETVGRTARELNEQIPPGRIETYGRVVRTGEPVYENYERGSGTWFETFAFQHSDNCFAVLIRDVTERRLAEQALRESEEKYRSLFESMDEGFALCELVRDAEGRVVDYRYLDLNSALVRHANIAPEALRGRRATEIFPDLDPWLIETYTRVVDLGQSVNVEHYFPHVGLWLRINAFPRGGDRFAVLYGNITARKLTEAALRESDQRLRLFGEASSHVIWMRCAETMRMEYVSPAFDTIYGTSRDAVLNRDLQSWTELIVQEDRQRAVGALDRVRAGERVTFEFRVLRPDGELRWLRNTDFPIPDENGQVARIGGIGQDVTEQKRADAALRENEERQAFLLQLSDALRAESDADAVADRALSMLFARLELDRCYVGVYRPSDDLAALTHQVGNDRVPPLPGQIRLSDFPEALRIATGQTLVIDDFTQTEGLSDADRRSIGALGLRALVAATLRRGENHPLWAIVAVSGRPRRWTAGEIELIEAVTERTWAAIERLRTEAALRESEERFRMLADNIAQLAWTCDELGNMTWYNQRWLEYTGRSAEDTNGWGWSRVLHPDHVDRVVAGIARSNALGEPWTDTFPLRGKDEQYRWFLSRAIPIRDERGQTIRWFGTNTDVTELREANRAKDEFLAMLGHELRNPLAPIVSTLELMRLEGGRRFEKEREMMLRQARHLAALLDDLLDVARLARGKVELHRTTVGLDALVARAVEAAAPLLEHRRHHLRVDVEPGLMLSVDETRIVQVVSNLLNNAAHYTPPGGHIRVTGEREDRTVVLRVRDEGVGISPDLLPRVFERFEQGPRPEGRGEGGLGVGLAIVRSLVELHGGTVTAASEGRDKGSEFTVRLPARLARSSAPPAGIHAPSTPLRVSGQRILLVDDNRNITDVLAMLLAKSGNIVEKAYDAVTALHVAKIFVPTIAILDLGLPDMSGYELAKQLRKQKGLDELPLIALTGYGASADRQRSKRAGFAEHLPKPVELDDLLAAIGRISMPPAAKASPRQNRARSKGSKAPSARGAPPSASKSKAAPPKKRRS